MKPVYMAFTVGLVAAVLGLSMSFASTPRYGYLFAVIIVCDILAIVCLAYAFRSGGGWRFAILFPGLLVVYTVIDVIARALFGARVLDVLR